MASEINQPKLSKITTNTKNGCLIAAVFCVIFVIIMLTITFCGKISRESSARLCADYGYQCGETKGEGE